MFKTNSFKLLILLLLKTIGANHSVAEPIKANEAIFTGDLSQCQVVLEVKKPGYPWGSPQFRYVSPDKENHEAIGPGCHIDKGMKLCLLNGTDYVEIPSMYRDVADKTSAIKGWTPKTGSNVRVKILASSAKEITEKDPYMASYMWGRCSVGAQLFKKDKARIAKEVLDDLEMHLIERKSYMSFSSRDDDETDQQYRDRLKEEKEAESAEIAELENLVKTRTQKVVDHIVATYKDMQGVVTFRPEQFNVYINPNSPIPGLVTWQIHGTTFTFPLFTDASVSGGFREKRGLKRHLGLDFGTGGVPSPIFSIADGQIIKSEYCTTKQRGKCGAGFGNHIDISIPKLGCVVRYAHLNPKCVGEPMKRLKEGSFVRYGDHIGCVGNTGKSTGPHLHLEMNCPKELAYGKVPLRARLSNNKSSHFWLYIADPEDFVQIAPYKQETEILQYY